MENGAVVKKRSPGEGALYFDAKRKLWRGVVDIGFWPDGRRRQKAVTHRTQAGAREKLRALIKEIDEHGAPLDKQTSVAVWAEHWLTTVCQPNMKPNGLAAYESVTRNWIVPAIGKKKVAALRPSDIRTVTSGITSAGRSSSTALKAYNIMSGMFESARRDGLSARNVVADVDPPKAALSTVIALEDDAALAVLQASTTLVDGSRWWVAILEGLRQSERLGLRTPDLDFAAEEIHVAWALEEITSEHGCGEVVDGKWPCGMKRGASCSSPRLKVPDGFEYERLYGRLCFIRPKSGRTRDVPMPAPVAAALRLYLEATKDWPNPWGLVWRHPDGSPILPYEDEQDWRDVLHLAGIISEEQTKQPKDRAQGTAPVPGSHVARHTTATVLMNLGIDAKIVGEIIGHQSERVTRKHYQHVTSPIAKDAMGKLGAHFMEMLGLPAPGDDVPAS